MASRSQFTAIPLEDQPLHPPIFNGNSAGDYDYARQIPQTQGKKGEYISVNSTEPSLKVSETPTYRETLNDTIPQYGALSRYLRAVQNHWTYELIGLVVCVSTLISIGAVLFAYDGSPTPHVMGGVTLNTIISVLSTLSRAAAVYVAASVIAQRKWQRFEEAPRTSVELSLYDDATRGPLGSLYLLLSRRIGMITALAAIVAILSLGFEPFVQQAVKYPLKEWATSSTVVLPTVHNIALGTDAAIDVDGVNPDANLLSNIFYGALYADTVAPLTPICAGTSCEWPTYQTAGVCTACEDAMKDIVVTPSPDPALKAYRTSNHMQDFRIDDMFLSPMMNSYGNSGLYSFLNTTYNVSLGQGMSTNFDLGTTASIYMDDLAYNMRSLTYPKSIMWNLLGPDYFYLNMGGWGNWGLYWSNNSINGVPGPLRAYGLVNFTYSAAEDRLIPTFAQRCVLSICAKQVSSRMQNGSLTENVSAIEWGGFTKRYHNSTGLTNMEWTASLNGSSFRFGFTPDSRNCTTLDCPGNSNILYSLVYPFGAIPGRMWSYVGDGNSMVVADGYTWNSTYFTTPNLNTLKFMKGFGQTCQSLAQAFTNTFQQYGDANATGIVNISKPFVQVRWAWLSFPALLIIFVCTALIVTIIQTKIRHLPIWKNSPYPLIYNFPDRDQAMPPGGLVPHDTSSHRVIAGATHLRLRWVSGAWTFQRA